MKFELKHDQNYIKWLSDIKTRVRQVQLKAAVKVNTELLMFYWELGADIVKKQVDAKWGDGFLSQLSKDLTSEFTNLKGFSKRNLELIRQWYLFYCEKIQSPDLIAKQAVSQLPEIQNNQHPVAQIIQIPWGHNIIIVTKCKSVKEALYYVQNTITHNWSRSVLVHQIESGLYKREGKAVNNFTLTLPKPLSDLAIQTLKDPYIFDSQLKSESDQPTIGIIICKTKDKVVVEYALSDIKKPIGVSEYRLTQSLPKKFKSSLPSIKEIEAELSVISWMERWS
ncbi:DUF1016 domain-containing protein [Candidatus Desantisbacteria bacterium]|nr:DUF1016 domain-containing protein [Candidatus Desantisbacteria bacterium]